MDTQLVQDQSITGRITMLTRYFILRYSGADTPFAAAWIKTLSDMIAEDGDHIEVQHSEFECSHLFAVRISTAERNFTDDIKREIVPQMCDPHMNLGPCWQEVEPAAFQQLLHEIAAQEDEKRAKNAEFEEQQRKHKGSYLYEARHQTYYPDSERMIYGRDPR